MEEVKEVTEVVEEEKAFEPITSQEQLNKVIGERLAKKSAKVREEVTTELTQKYQDYDSLKDQIAKLETSNKEMLEAKDKYAELKKTNEELNAKIAQYELDSVKKTAAIAYGLPMEMATRLNGTTKEEIEADALALSRLIPKSSIPIRNQEAEETDEFRALWNKRNPHSKI